MTCKFSVLAVQLVAVVCHVGHSFIIDDQSFKEKTSSRRDSATNAEEVDTQYVNKWMREMITYRREMGNTRTRTVPT